MRQSKLAMFIDANENKSDYKIFTCESSYCFQRVLAIAILSVCLSVRHTGGSVKNSAS